MMAGCSKTTAQHRGVLDSQHSMNSEADLLHACQSQHTHLQLLDVARALGLKRCGLDISEQRQQGRQHVLLCK